MDTELLDLDFGPEPPLVAPEARLYAGRRALRRRRLASGVGVTAAALAISGVGWGLTGLGPADGNRGDRFASPSARTIDIPLATGTCAPPSCIGFTFQDEDIRQPMLAYREGELVTFRSDVQVTGLIVDPLAAGVTNSAAVDFQVDGDHVRAFVTEEFGYFGGLGEGRRDEPLARWFATHDAFPMGGCGGKSPNSSTEPGCPVRLDEAGDVLPAKGTTVLKRLDNPDLGQRPVGVVTALEVKAAGQRWFVLAQTIRSGDVFRVDYAPAQGRLLAWAVATFRDSGAHATAPAAGDGR